MYFSTPLCNRPSGIFILAGFSRKKSLGWQNSHWVGLVFDYVFVIGLFLEGLLVYSIKTWPIEENAGFSIAFPLSASKVAALYSPWARTPKITFRYHSGGVMLSYIFENCIYSSFILCMIAVLNE